MHQPFRLALRGNQVIPAASDDSAGAEVQNTIGQRISLVMVEEQPTVQFLLSKRFLYFVNVHVQFSKNGFHFPGRGGAVIRLTTIRLITDAPKAG